LIHQTLYSFNSHGKEAFPGAMGVKSTEAVTNKVAEEKWELLANFTGSDYVTQDVTAEYKHYMKGCYLELQQRIEIDCMHCIKSILEALLHTDLGDSFKKNDKIYNDSNPNSTDNCESDPDIDEEDDSEQQRIRKKFHPFSQSFFYEVLGSKEFCGQLLPKIVAVVPAYKRSTHLKFTFLYSSIIAEICIIN
jgi:hypothetical protein